ncbi:hypothetical protein Hanom_Chr06g00548551 [Helianthus anomalus]
MLNVLQVDLAGFVTWCGISTLLMKTNGRSCWICYLVWNLNKNFIDEEVHLAGFVIWCQSLEFVL